MRGEFFNAFDQVNFNNRVTNYIVDDVRAHHWLSAPAASIQLAAKLIW